MSPTRHRRTIAVVSLVLHLLLVGGNHAWHGLLSTGHACSCGCCAGAHETTADDELVFYADETSLLESDTAQHDAEHCPLCQCLAAPAVAIVAVAAPLCCDLVRSAGGGEPLSRLTDVHFHSQARAPPVLMA